LTDVQIVLTGVMSAQRFSQQQKTSSCHLAMNW